MVVLKNYEATLVAKGFLNKRKMLFFDTYSPSMCITSNRILLAVVAIYVLYYYEMDVKTIFENRELEERIYLDKPEGFIIKLVYFYTLYVV